MPARVRPLRRLSTCLMLAIFVAFAVACGKGSARKQKVLPTVKVNEELRFQDSTWTAVEVKDLGKTMKATDGSDDVQKTDGRFVLVRFKVSNPGTSILYVAGFDPDLLDARDRTYERLGDDYRAFFPQGAVLLQDFDPAKIKAGQSAEYTALYEVPADATGLKMRCYSPADDARGEPLEMGYVDLGL
jgi:hypothetical protein